MEQLVTIARGLAQDAVDAAIDHGGDSGDIADAVQYLAEGDDLRAEGKFKDAVAKYKDALSKVEGAL